MPGKLLYNLSFDGKYGSIPPRFNFQLEDGYSVFIGKNDAGKSTLLQWIFRNLYSNQEISKESFCLILPNRNYITPHTRTTATLGNFNRVLWDQINSHPQLNDQHRVSEMNDLYSVLLQTKDFMSQMVSINEYLARMNFKPITLGQQQITYLDGTPLHQHGAGVRHVTPILAALTSPNIKVILIDEPEIALEARAQKVLKEILIEASREKVIVLATQSHLFIQKESEQCDKNYIVSNIYRTSDSLDSNSISIDRVGNASELVDLTFNLLGNSLEDLFFPGNFLVVEGASDQAICEKVQELLNINAFKLKVIAARGIDNISSSYESIVNTLIPLTAGTSPYSKRVVVLVDQPNMTNNLRVKSIQKHLKTRCLLLNSTSLEEYIPESLYRKAGRDKKVDIQDLIDLYGKRKTIAGLEPYRQKKKEISSSIAKALEKKDLKLIPVILEAVKLAASNA